MDDLLRDVTSILDRDAIQSLSDRIDASPQQTRGAVDAALPVLLGMLANNTRSEPECQSLAKAVERDHSGGGILDQVHTFLAGGNTNDGQGILGHVLGSRQGPAQDQLARKTGLNGSQIGTLLALLAPIVLGALGRQTGGQDGAQPDRLAALLQGALGQLARGSGDAQGGGLAVLGDLLKGSGSGADTSGLDGLLQQGAGMLGGLLKR